MERKPPAKVMESRDPWSIRFCPSEREAIAEAARERGIEPSTFARDLCLIGLMLVQTPRLLESYVRGTAVLQSSHARKTAG